MIAHFGPAGSAESFHQMGYRKTIQMPEYLERFSLNAFEYQCGRGVRVPEETAAVLGKRAQEKGILLSLHAPYYISLASLEEEKRNNSIQYILQSARAAKAMGAARIVVHSGALSGQSRAEALSVAKQTLMRAQQCLDEEGLSEIHICPETMGKINQLGDLEEVLELCSLEERWIPCIDFGHLNARTLGQMNSAKAFEALLDRMVEVLGSERGRQFHAHFSKIEYTPKGGEKRHLTFEDTVYGPSFEPLIELLAKRGCTPTIICESAGTQAEDAQTMKQYYERCLLSMKGVLEEKDF